MKGALAVALAVALGAAAGCHRRLPSLLEDGKVDEVIARAESSRFVPRRKAAHAYATALVRRGQVDKAISVLLVDFRKGGYVPSLVALADLERALGLDGLAAVHYANVAALDRKMLVGREEVCAMFRQRARELLRLGEALAAEDDLDRVERLCGAPKGRSDAMQDQALRRRIDEAADAQVEARISGATCPPEGCREPSAAERRAAVEAELEQARRESPAALRRASARLETTLTPEDIVTLLLAEARGELGLAALPDDEVRRWVGEQGWLALSPLVMARSPAEAAWLQLRLSAVVEDMPIAPAPAVGPSQRDRWADRALELTGAERWRILGWAGDFPGAELALATEFRPAPAAPAAPTTDEDPPADEASGAVSAAPSEGSGTLDRGPSHGVPAPSHWAARVEPSRRSLAAMLWLARLREAAGEADRALEILRFSLAQAHAAGIAPAPQLAVREAARRLTRGQPWHALAIVDALPIETTRPAMRAAASAIALDWVFCAGPCPDDEDRAVVTRVLGEAWVTRMTQDIPELSRASRARAEGEDVCPSLAERIGPDASGPVADALRRAQASLEGPGLGDALGKAVASDLTLTCAARQLLPLMAVADVQLSAAQLSDLLAYGPQMRASSMLWTHTALAMLGRQSMRAELLAVRSGATSNEPVATWYALARLAHGLGDRELERRGLHETILHTPNLDDEPARRALVVAALHDLQRSWQARRTEVGRQAVQRHVAAYLDAFAPSQRWAHREGLARTVGRAAWAEPIRPSLVEALLPEESMRAAHPVAMAWLTGGERVDGAGPLDAEALALAFDRGPARSLPPVADTFGDPAAFEAARLATARGARDWTLRRRMAIGLAVYATAPSRAAAIVELETMIGDDEDRLRALHELLLDRPAALEPSGPVAAEHVPGAAIMVEDEEALLRVLYGLDPALAWFARASGGVFGEVR